LQLNNKNALESANGNGGSERSLVINKLRMEGRDMAGVPLRAIAPVWPEVWDSVRSRMLVEVGQGVYDTWIVPLALASVIDGHVTLAAPKRYIRDHVAQHYAAKLERAFVDNATEFVTLHLTVDETAIAVKPAGTGQIALRPVPPAPPPAIGGNGSGGNAGLWDREPDPQQTFASFVSGPTNDFAVRAAKSVADGGDEISLLFIHGGFGYGKTHLLNAIAAHCTQTKRARALFLRAEDFMRKFIAALRDRDTLTFKDELRGADVLLLDDLQHICGRATVSEFLHTLNAFTDGKRKLVIAADRPPAQLEGLPEDVSSRLKGALTVALEKPDSATRLAILKAKATEWEKRRPRAALAESVLERLAAEVDGPPRELLGVFNRLATYTDLTGHPVTREFVDETIALRGSSPDRRITIEEIQKKTAEFYKLELKDLQSQCRAWRVARPRQVAMYLARQLTARSLPDIGRRFGGRDHTTVLHACKRITALCENDPVFQQEVDFLRRILGRAPRA
jgi:chromosomal replication initiator protein